MAALSKRANGWSRMPVRLRKDSQLHRANEMTELCSSKVESH